jgi:hypothetical protein
VTMPQKFKIEMQPAPSPPFADTTQQATRDREMYVSVTMHPQTLKIETQREESQSQETLHRLLGIYLHGVLSPLHNPEL